MKRIAIFASGNGTNAEAIAKYFTDRDDIEVALTVSNRKGAGVHERMKALGIPTVTLGKECWQQEGEGAQRVIDLMMEENIDLIVLAGFLAIIPDKIIDAYSGRIVNIHPSLLPRHGGKGMYDHHVHQSVLELGDRESGITIHYVTSKIDGGDIILQAHCPVEEGDTPDTLAERIHPLEHRYFPQVIDQLLSSC